jgi:hypothetical protein
MKIKIIELETKKKGSPVNVALAYAGSREGSDHFKSYAAFPSISAKGYFQNLNPWPHGHKATALPLRQGSPKINRAISYKG